MARIGLVAGDVRVGARLTLKCDPLGSAHARSDSTARARAKSAGVSTPKGTVSTMAGDAPPGAPNCFEFFPPLKRRRRKLDEALKGRAAEGVESDVVIKRPL